MSKKVDNAISTLIKRLEDLGNTEVSVFWMKGNDVAHLITGSGYYFTSEQFPDWEKNFITNFRHTDRRDVDMLRVTEANFKVEIVPKKKTRRK